MFFSVLRLVPVEQNLVASNKIDSDVVFPAWDRRVQDVVCGIEIDLNLVPPRHVASDTIVVNSFRQLRPLLAVFRLVTCQTGALARASLLHIRCDVRVVACDAGQAVALLIAFQIGRLSRKDKARYVTGSSFMIDAGLLTR